MATKLYSLEAVDKLTAQYLSKGGEVVVTREGALLDDLIMFGEGLKTTIITAVYLNEWSSAYSSKSYNRTPKKYLKFIN